MYDPAPLSEQESRERTLSEWWLQDATTSRDGPREEVRQALTYGLKDGLSIWWENERQKAYQSEDDDTSTCASALDRQLLTTEASSTLPRAEQRRSRRNSEVFALSLAVAPTRHAEKAEDEEEENEETDEDAEQLEAMSSCRPRTSTVSDWYSHEEVVADVVIGKTGEPVVLTIQCLIAIEEEDEDAMQEGFWGAFEQYCSDVTTRLSLTGNLHGAGNREK